MRPTGKRGSGAPRGLALKLSIVVVALLFVSVPAFAKSGNDNNGHRGNGNGHVKVNYDPELLQSVSSACLTGSAQPTCQGGYNATQTFGSPLSLGDIVTVTMAFAPSASGSPDLAISDSLGNNVTIVSTQSTTASPVICTEVGYFLVTVAGADDISFTAVSGTAGCLHYTAEDWYAANSQQLAPLGSSGYCSGTCTTSLSVPPIAFGEEPSEVIAVSAYYAVFSGPLSSWTASLPYYAYSNSALAGGGYALLFQATNSTAASFGFVSTASESPAEFAGSAEVLYV